MSAHAAAAQGRGQHRLRAVVLAFAGLGLVAAVTIVAHGMLARPAAADVAIVFGNQVRRDGTPSPRLVARLAAAARLTSLVRVWFVSGGIGREGHDETIVMREWLVAHGVPDSAIVRDSLGLDSGRTAANAAAWMRAHGARRAVIVTQYFHVARATLACRRAGIDVVGASAPAWFEVRDLYSLAREIVALPVYAVLRR
jgi:vancomycin permeability regulator SanA